MINKYQTSVYLFGIFSLPIQSFIVYINIDDKKAVNEIKKGVKNLIRKYLRRFVIVKLDKV